MIMQWLDTIIGELPQHYDYNSALYYSEYYAIVQYIIAGVILIFMVSCFYRVLIAMFGKWVR